MNFFSVTSDDASQERFLITVKQGETLIGYQAEYDSVLNLVKHYTGHLELGEALIDEIGAAVRYQLDGEEIRHLFYIPR